MQFPTSPRPLSSIQFPSWPAVLPGFLPRVQKLGLASPREPQSPVCQPTVGICKPAEPHKTSQRNIRANTSEQTLSSEEPVPGTGQENIRFTTPHPKPQPQDNKTPRALTTNKQAMMILVCQDPQSSFILGTAIYLQDCPVSLFPLQAIENKSLWLTCDPFSWKQGWLSLLSSPLQKVELGQDRKSQGKKLCAVVTSQCPPSIVKLIWNHNFLYYSFLLIPCLCFLQNLTNLLVNTGDKFYMLDISGKFFRVKKHEQGMQGVKKILCNDSIAPISELYCELIHDPVRK